MEALFKKYFWVIKTLGIAAACGLAASAVTTQIGASMLFDAEVGDEDEADSDGDSDGDDEDDDGGTKAKTKTKKSKGFSFDDDAFGGSSASSKAKDKDRVAERIRKHNVFCPTCAPPEAEASEADDGGLDASGRPTGPVLSPGETKSKLPLRLVTTMEAVEAEDSLATILDTEVGVAGLFGRGDLVRKGVEVVGVEQGLVHLRNNAALEYIEIGDDAPPPPRATAPTADDDKAAPPKNDRAIEGAEEAINCPNESSCTVERAFVEKLMANPALLAKQARIVAKQKDGEVAGYKLYGIRRGSLPKLLGLKNGDMITAVNGEELKSMDKAMALYSKLRRASNLSVSIERKGKTITKDIQIQ